MKRSDILEQSPRDWETTMRQKIFMTVFHKQNIRQNVWKTLRTTLLCFVFLLSRGKGYTSKENCGTDFPIVFLVFLTFSRDWRKQNIKVWF